ncbi:MAG: SusD/RagB family nutrient-binding outer membrane lipoprotein [Sediminibacterium sp.]
MMNMKKLMIYCSVALLLVSCSKLNDDFNGLLNNPNQPTPNSADVDLYLNSIQLSFSNFYTGLSDLGGQLTRMEIMFGPTYNAAYQPQTTDGTWSTAYASVFKNVNAMIPVAYSQKRTIHVGIGKILKAYTMMTLVDYFGDIPYSQANLGTANTNPGVDKGKAVYDSAIALLNSAITDLSTSGPLPTNDIFYGGSRVNWRTLAKTLKLKAYMNYRLADAATATTNITALIAENDLINSTSQDFQFQYGSKSLAPDSRHYKYAGNYTPTGAGDYLGNYFMWTMVTEKGIIDPRTRYYFYRQTTDITAAITDPVTLQFTVPCRFQAYPANFPTGTVFCKVTDGYFGRDHGDNSGTPPDNQFRTTWGVYPAGGQFDANQNTPVKPGIGGLGQGILPIWISAFTDFLKAEAVLTLNVSGDAKASTISGINKSITKVLGFPALVGVTPPASLVPSPSNVNNYTAYVGNAYDGASTNAAKLAIVAKELYISSWGNGIESYNLYRRTGSQAIKMQPALQPNPGAFIRSFFYPSVYVNFNNSATQKADLTTQVFWDTNPKTGWVY